MHCNGFTIEEEFTVFVLWGGRGRYRGGRDEERERGREGERERGREGEKGGEGKRWRELVREGERVP